MSERKGKREQGRCRRGEGDFQLEIATDAVPFIVNTRVSVPARTRAGDTPPQHPFLRLKGGPRGHAAFATASGRAAPTLATRSEASRCEGAAMNSLHCQLPLELILLRGRLARRLCHSATGVIPRCGRAVSRLARGFRGTRGCWPQCFLFTVCVAENRHLAVPPARCGGFCVVLCCL